jgi:hypothetical protein
MGGRNFQSCRVLGATFRSFINTQVDELMNVYAYGNPLA